jgi:phosphatidylserine decarboxylase
MTALLSYAQFEVNPYPSNLQSGWLPPYGSASMQKYFDRILGAPRKPLAPSVQSLDALIEGNTVIDYLVDNACAENLGLIDAHLPSAQGVPLPRITDKDALLHGFNVILTEAPAFINDDLVGLPFSAFVVGIDPTLSGATLFRLPMFNEKMSAILADWNGFLDTPASNVGFRVEHEQWLSPAAKKQYDFPIWKKDSPSLPYWKSWNSFFTRNFSDPEKARPIADLDSNQTVICPNDGSLFRWDANIARKDAFWLKDMNYSLSDILSSPLPAQQQLIDEYNLVDLFEGGYIFQTYLNPYNFHRWWVPVNGEVVFDPFTVPGCFFNKLVLPDFGGATTASLPYLAQVNVRGMMVIKTEDYGHVCCIPLGMSEVSSVVFDPAMKAGARVTKGQEMGMFNYGGSSFAMIYEKLPGKELLFVNNEGVPYPQRPVLPTGSSSTGGNVTLIGSQIGVWYSRK